MIPSSRLVQVIYMRGSVKQSAVIPNPRTNDGLIVAMLKKQIGSSQIQRVDAVKEWAPRS